MAMRVCLYFPTALRIVEAVMERGARTHPGEDWRALPAGCHLARARRHLELLAVGDVSEPHLAHAACRLLMELERARDAQRGGSPSWLGCQGVTNQAAPSTFHSLLARLGLV
jgi:hypothetical protein